MREPARCFMILKGRPGSVRRPPAPLPHATCGALAQICRIPRVGVCRLWPAAEAVAGPAVRRMGPCAHTAASPGPGRTRIRHWLARIVTGHCPVPLMMRGPQPAATPPHDHGVGEEFSGARPQPAAVPAWAGEGVPHALCAPAACRPAKCDQTHLPPVAGSSTPQSSASCSTMTMPRPVVACWSWGR